MGDEPTGNYSDFLNRPQRKRGDGFVTGFERVLNERDQLKEILKSGVQIIEDAVAHVSHGGPTREDAEKWLRKAKNILDGAA